MNLNHLPGEDFPFGNNIHFVYELSSAQFLFLHTTLQWVVTTEGLSDLAAAVVSKIEQEDLTYLKDAFKTVISGRFNGKITVRLHDSDGDRWLLVVPGLAEYQAKQVIIGTVAEVTDEVRNAQSIHKYADKKNSVLHMLGHDLRGSLNIARSLMKTVNRDLKDPVLLEKTSHIATIVQHSIDMISDLVKREFLEMVNLDLVRKRIDIVRLVRDYMEECKRSQTAAITLKFKSSSRKIFIRLDPAKFMQVINNLISNALKFTPAGGTISVGIEEQPGQVSLTFSDNGIGIPEALLPHIFEKFTPARRLGLQGEPTSGLGLSIVKTIISWHGGTITCESGEGAGTSFFISLPKLNPFKPDAPGRHTGI